MSLSPTAKKIGRFTLTIFNMVIFSLIVVISTLIYIGDKKQENVAYRTLYAWSVFDKVSDAQTLPEYRAYSDKLMELARHPDHSDTAILLPMLAVAHTTQYGRAHNGDQSVWEEEAQKLRDMLRSTSGSNLHWLLKSYANRIFDEDRQKEIQLRKETGAPTLKMPQIAFSDYEKTALQKCRDALSEFYDNDSRFVYSFYHLIDRISPDIMSPKCNLYEDLAAR